MTPEQEAAKGEVETVAEMAEAFKRSGLRVGAAQIANMVEGYRFVCTGLKAVRDRLPQTTEPALTFNSAKAYRASGREDNDANG